MLAFLAPLFFVIAFPILFVGAIHQPTPHDLSLLVVGPDRVVAQISNGLDRSAEFSADHTDVAGEARSSVAQRKVMGSIEVVPRPGEVGGTPTFTVTTYLASAEGQAVASTVRAVGAKVAAQLGATPKFVDVAPLGKQDPLGTNLFYLLTFTSLAAYLVIIVLMQVMPGARLRVRYGAVAAAAVLAPVIVFGLSSIFVGDYGASFGTIAALLGVNALYVFTVGAAAVLIEQFLGSLATVGIMGFIVLLNFPSSGGPTPAAMLPPFWQAVHNFYFGSGAYESFRSIIYFQGDGSARWILQLLGWTVGLVLVTVIVHLARVIRTQRTRIGELTAAVSAGPAAVGLPEEGAVELPVERVAITAVDHRELEPASGFDPQADNERRSISAGDGATR